MRYAIITDDTFLVDNVIIYDGVSEWAPQEGFFMIETDIGDIGDTYDPETGEFIKPSMEE